MFGYMGKMLFANLSERTLEDRPLSESDARNFLGGPSLGAKVLYENMPKDCDAFAEESMFGIVTGPLTGTRAFFSGRYTVVSKSPVTGGWNDANSGGFFGPALKHAGYDAVFVNGISETPVYIFIDEGKAQILDATEAWGLKTEETEEYFKKIHGDKINVALVGPAGESLSNVAAVMNDGHRAAGRGGTGAVMGSKKLKAIVVSGSLSVEVADSAKLTECNRAISEFMKGPGKMMADGFGTFGTGMLYNNSTQNGDSGIKNWSGAGVVDYAGQEASMAISSIGIDKFKTAKYSCANCPLGCGAFHNYTEGTRGWDLSHAPRPEYETMASFGSMLLNTDAECIFICNEICNAYGLDTISAGSIVAWAMEAYNEGALTLDDLDGIDLKWGNADAIIALTEKIGKGEGVGAILAKGTQAAAKHFGKGEEFLVVASGIEEPQHDSRLGYGLSRTYKYDPTPGRHVKGGIGMGVQVPAGGIDYSSTGHQDKLGVADTELTNSSGYCLFGGMCTPPGGLLDLINAVTGFNYSKADSIDLGMRMYNMRALFNVREGLRRKDFTLSPRFTAAPPPTEGPIAGNVIDVEKLADNFFNAIGWDGDGVPLRQTLEHLGGFDEAIAELYPAPQFPGAPGA